MKGYQTLACLWVHHNFSTLKSRPNKVPWQSHIWKRCLELVEWRNQLLLLLLIVLSHHLHSPLYFPQPPLLMLMMPFLVLLFVSPPRPPRPEHVNLWLSPDALTPALWIKAPNKRIHMKHATKNPHPRNRKLGMWCENGGSTAAQFLFYFVILFYFIVWGQFCAVGKVMIIHRKI